MILETEAALERYTSLVREGKQSQMVLPDRILPHGKLNTHDSQYRFDINVGKFADLYQQEIGLSAEQIGKIELHIIGEGVLPLKNLTKKDRKELFPFGNPLKTRLEKFFGGRDVYAVTHDVEGRTLIVFYPVVLWSDLNKDRNTILKYVRKRQKDPQTPELQDKQTEIFKITKRFLRYLEKAPAERVGKFLERLGTIRANKILLRNIIHEGAHVQEDSAKKRHPLLEESWFIEIIYFLERFSKKAHDYLEKKAEEEEERVGRKPQWFDVVDFKINKPENPPVTLDSTKKAA